MLVPPPLTSGRILPIDAFRGLTFVLMLFVNFVAGASGIPAGIHHVGAEVDGMGLADMVFPAFLFAVGMSIPFAIQARLSKGEHGLPLQRHIAVRAASLILIGVFMVSMESGYNEQAMGMPIALWSLAFYLAVILVWGSFRFRQARSARLLRGAGLLLIAVLAAVYRSGAHGSGWMSTQWWGILGCIGWAYLAASLVYQLTQGKPWLLMLGIAACVLVFAASKAWDTMHVVAMHATHTSIALAGTACALLLFASSATRPARRVLSVLGFSIALALAGWALHQVYPVSKIGGTPPWALYCAAICGALFAALHCVTEFWQRRAWTGLVEPAASSPLVTYLIPFVLGALMALFGLSWPAPLVHGAGALAFALVFSAAVVALVAWLNSRNFKLTL